VESFGVNQKVSTEPTQHQIANEAKYWTGRSDKQFIPAGADCHEGCVYTVNGLVKATIGCGMTGVTASTDEIKASSMVTQVMDQDNTVAGDLIIEDATSGDAHVGIFLNDGCTEMMSNGSHNCVFSFGIPTSAYFVSPGGGPYNSGSIGTFWRVGACA